MTAHAPSTTTLTTLAATATAHRDGALLARHGDGRAAAVRRGGDLRVAPTIERRSGTVAPRPLDLDPASRAAEAERLAAAVSTWYLEALRGRRDSRQLRRLLTPVAEHRVRACVLRATTAQRTTRQPLPPARVHAVRVVAVGARYEAVTMMTDGRRTTAVVAVLHPTDRGWIISDLARPEDNLPAQPVPVLR